MVNNVSVTAYSAGHVIGAAMYCVELNNYKLFYTGDYSMEKDRHLNSADLPQDLCPDVLLTEGTYGTLLHTNRQEREKALTDKIQTTLRRGGKVLLPVFSVGRVQELTAILDEYWHRNPDLQRYQIHYISQIGQKFRRATEKFIRHEENDAQVQQEPCVIFATPGML